MFLSMLLVMLIVGGVDGTGVAKSLASSHVVGMLCFARGVVHSPSIRQTRQDGPLAP